MTTQTVSRPPREPIAATAPITSSLSEGRQRFLAQVVQHAITCGRRSSKDFIRHFPPKAIMLALAGQPRLRANILVATIGVNEKVALKKSAESSGEDVQIAVDERVTDEESILRLFEPDDRVRYLEDKKLWAFVAEGEFWKSTDSGPALAPRKEHVAYIVDCARVNGLLSAHDIVQGLTLDLILDRLPKAELAKIIRGAFTEGREGRKFDDATLLGIMPPVALLEHVSLAQMWDAVVVPKIAEPHGLAGSQKPQVKPPPLPPDDEEVVVEVIEAAATGGGAPARVQKSRRMDAGDVSELKRELDVEAKN